MKDSEGGMEFQNISLEVKEGIAKLIIDRPPVNVMNWETLVEINAALEEVQKDDEAKVLLIRGSGNKAFSAGVEVKDHLGERM
ncbi:MAG: enoyl-CoA hydratase/isomerase family protein, partial [Dehalococcoidia bacterium]